MIHSKTYYDHIVAYLDLRVQAQNKFHHPELEIAFSEFDRGLVQFDRKMSITYSAYFVGYKVGQKLPDDEELDKITWIVSAKKDAHFDGRWLTDEQYTIVQENYDELVQQSIALVQQSNKLVASIHSIVPNFFADQQ